MRTQRVACVLVLCASAWCWADARTEAKRHFKSGMSLIAEKKFDDGINELLEAYAIKPHPNVLFNVAKAHEAAGRPREALHYYRRYLATNPADTQDISAAIARLEASEEPVVTKPDEKPALPTPTTAQAKVDDATVAKLEALTARLEKALERAEKTEATPAEKPQAAPNAANVEGQPNEEGADFAVPYEETVVAASRRAQSTLEAPNATTIITGDEIRASGLQSLPELLRRVPGAEVMQMSYSSTNVSIRGFNQRVANKVLLLIDGRPEYQDFLGITQYSMIPIGVEEIERIEVIRGPGSALYGANAMLGVINVITRTPGTGKKAEFNAFLGNGNMEGGSFVASGGDAVKYRASIGYQQSNKFTRDYDPSRADVASTFVDPNLSLRSLRGNLTAFYALNKDFSVAVSAGANRLFSELYALGLLRNYWIDGLGGYAKVDLTGGPLKLRLFWNHFTTDSAPEYEPVGQRSLATHLESNVFDAELFFQKEFKLAGTHLVALGISTRLKRNGWGYVGRLISEVHAAAFVQDEWRPIKPLSLVGSYRIDRHPLLDNGNPGYAQSPRVSAVFTPTEGQAVRASFATAFRQPTLFESYVSVKTPVPGVNGATVLSEGNRALKPERLISFELGYRGEAASLGLSWDVALYWNIVSDLVILSAVQPVPAEQALDPSTQAFVLGRSIFSNDPTTYNAPGGEVGVTWGGLKGLDVRGSVALQKIFPQQALMVCGRCTEAPTAKFNVGFIYRSPVNVDVSADFSYVTGTTWVEREPSAADPTQIVNLQNALKGYAVLNARVGYRLLNDRLSIAVVGTQLGPDHQEHPFGNNLSRRVFAQVTVTP